MPKVPERAVFYWDGDRSGMSWLRQRALESFAALNPGWEIVVIGPRPGLAVPAPGRRGVVQRSDWSRWIELHESGGVYFDTDILWVQPVPEEWLRYDVGLVTDGESGGVCSVGSAIASPGNPFYASLVQFCESRSRQRLIPNFQAYGIYIFNSFAPMMERKQLPTIRALVQDMGLSYFPIPRESIQPVSWADTSSLWSPIDFPLGNDTIGLHWYGGDALTREFEPIVDEKWCKENPCPVSSAALAVQGIHA